MKWIEAELGLGGRTPWSKGEHSYASGWIEFDGQILSGADLVALLDAIENLEDIKVDGGEYLLVKVLANGVQLKADRIASIPIFYAFGDEEIHLSPNPQNLVNFSGSKLTSLNRAQLAALLSCGMSLGQEGLYQGLNRVQAHEMLTLVDGAKNGAAMRSVRASPTIEYKQAKEKAKVLLEQAVARTLKSIGDRDICIPLSGGMDSRLLAFLLQDMGSNSISCFSYGRRNSFESERSEVVAKDLGLDWRFVEYTPKKWKSWWQDDRYQDYRRWASLLTAIEHEQDWPAVLTLKESGELRSDSVFIPGHSMDFIAGSHLPESIPDELEEFILGKYFNLWPWQEMGGDVEALVRKNLSSLLEKNGKSGLERFDEFGLKERQSKMIANSVRVYEHHGYEWRLPYWDPELVEFFLSLPLEWRIGKRLYLDLCQDILPKSLMELPFTPPDLGSLENKWTRLTDRNFSRQSMFSNSKVLKSIPSQSIGSEIAKLPEDIRAWFEPIKKKPLVSIPFNGQLALHQLLDRFKD